LLALGRDWKEIGEGMKKKKNEEQRNLDSVGKSVTRYLMKPLFLDALAYIPARYNSTLRHLSILGP
jgi:hypothetical protein